MIENTELKHLKTPPSALEKLFSKGFHSAILSAYDRGEVSSRMEESEWILGSLCFQGRTLEAEEIYVQREGSFDERRHVAGAFYLGMGMTRKSLYARARKLFRTSFEKHRKNPDPRIQFYLYQGLAFYFYFTGEFDRAASWAEKSLRAALRAHHALSEVLAQDLMGHALVQTGKIHQGLDLLGAARKKALRLQHRSFVEAIEVSTLLYKAQFGFESKTILEALEKELGLLNREDSYSHSSLSLEIARQQTLRGEFAAAGKILDEIAPKIYSSQNRRQEILLNLRWAENSFLQGAETAAWQFVRSAQRCLDQEVDKNFEIQILETELKILENHNPEIFAQKKERLIALSRKFSSHANRNRLARRQRVPGNESFIDDEDEIHRQLLQLESSPEKALATVFETGYYSWLFKVLPIRRGQKYLYIGLEKSSLTIFSSQGIAHRRLPALGRQLLAALARGPLSKAELVEKVWGYRYHPLRHDAVVYAALSSLRKIMGENANWIQTTETGYALNSDVQVEFYGDVKSPSQNSHRLPLPAVLPEFSDLNYRQIQALEHLKQQAFVNTRTYARLFTTSEITASRDLSLLKNSGHVIKVGFGRATQYALARRKS